MGLLAYQNLDMKYHIHQQYEAWHYEHGSRLISSVPAYLRGRSCLADRSRRLPERSTLTSHHTDHIKDRLEQS